MKPLPQQILELVANSPGLTDREITNRLRGKSSPQQPINIAARALEKRSRLLRKKRQDGLIVNFLADGTAAVFEEPERPEPEKGSLPDQSEDKLKHWVQEWLVSEGWEVDVAWGRDRGGRYPCNEKRDAMDY